MINKRNPDRLYCCTCGADIGDATDPYADPNCAECLEYDSSFDCEEAITEAEEVEIE